MLPLPSTATPRGALKRASLPAPSLVPGPPAIPANVLMTPAELTWRMVLFSESATQRRPLGEEATPSGPLKVPFEPSARPVTPDIPASVFCTQFVPLAMIFRIVASPGDTNRGPAVSTAIPPGAGTDNSVVVIQFVPAGAIFRIRLLPVSATYRFPL